MSTCLEVLKSAYRRANLLAMASTVSGTELDSILSSVGMERLQGFYNKLALNGGLGRLEEYYANANYEAEENQQVFNSGGDTITIPDTVVDDSTGLTRAPRHGAVVVVINGAVDPFTVETNIYDSHSGWLEISSLAAADYAPLSRTHDEHLKNLLAEYLAAEDGTPVTDLLRRDVAKANLALASMYGNTRKNGKFVYY